MIASVGDIVVYAHHGPARVEAIETRTFRGEPQDFLILRIEKGDLTIAVPASNAEQAGIRAAASPDELRRVFGILSGPQTPDLGNWSRRYKANLDKLASGDAGQVAEIVRDLSGRRHGLSTAEKRMLAKARHLLLSEMAVAEQISEKDAETHLDQLLKAGRA